MRSYSCRKGMSTTVQYNIPRSVFMDNYVNVDGSSVRGLRGRPTSDRGSRQVEQERIKTYRSSSVTS